MIRDPGSRGRALARGYRTDRDPAPATAAELAGAPHESPAEGAAAAIRAAIEEGGGGWT